MGAQRWFELANILALPGWAALLFIGPVRRAAATRGWWGLASPWLSSARSCRWPGRRASCQISPSPGSPPPPPIRGWR
ncbi:hypothetical protein AB5I41_27935 [Sphingomonas sp. MMS24-JH45]